MVAGGVVAGGVVVGGVVAGGVVVGGVVVGGVVAGGLVGMVVIGGVVAEGVVGIAAVVPAWPPVTAGLDCAEVSALPVDGPPPHAVRAINNVAHSTFNGLGFIIGFSVFTIDSSSV